jgi:hypothetical protein
MPLSRRKMVAVWHDTPRGSQTSRATTRGKVERFIAAWRGGVRGALNLRNAGVAPQTLGSGAGGTAFETAQHKQKTS